MPWRFNYRCLQYMMRTDYTFDCEAYLLGTLFKRDHLGRTHQSTGSSVLNRGVGDGELS